MDEQTPQAEAMESLQQFDSYTLSAANRSDGSDWPNRQQSPRFATPSEHSELSIRAQFSPQKENFYLDFYGGPGGI